MTKKEFVVNRLIFCKISIQFSPPSGTPSSPPASDLARQTGVRWCPSPDMFRLALVPKKCLSWTHFVHFHWLKTRVKSQRFWSLSHFPSLEKAAHPSNYRVVKQPNPAPPFTFKMLSIICCRPVRSPAPNFFKSSSCRNAAEAVGWDRGTGYVSHEAVVCFGHA